MSKLNEFAITGLGKGNDESNVKIHHRKDGIKGERYEFTWPKSYEICSAAVGLVAANYKSQNLPTLDFFDYLSDFMDLITPKSFCEDLMIFLRRTGKSYHTGGTPCAYCESLNLIV